MDEEWFKDFMKDVARGDSARFLKQERPPQARWARPDILCAIEALTYDPAKPDGKVLVGALGSHLIGIKDDRHVLTGAGSRSGKSVCLVSNLCFYDGSVLVTDPKGELARLTAKRRAKKGQRVHVLDPFGVTGDAVSDFKASYNPMDILKAGSPTFLEDAALIAESTVVQSPDQRDPHWDESARNFIEGVIVHVATAKQYEARRSLVTVRELLKRALWVAPDDEGDGCRRRFKSEPLRRPNIEPGVEANFEMVGCG